MKYKTIIEVVCDSFSEEEAAYTAGEYLRGNELDPGIEMTCSTTTVSGAYPRD